MFLFWYDLLTTIFCRSSRDAADITATNLALVDQTFHLLWCDLSASVGSDFKYMGNDHALEVATTSVTNVCVFVDTNNWNGPAGHILHEVNWELDVGDLCIFEDSRQYCLTNCFLCFRGAFENLFMILRHNWFPGIQSEKWRIFGNSTFSSLYRLEYGQKFDDMFCK